MSVYQFYISLFKYQKKFPLLLFTVVISNIFVAICVGILPLIVKTLLDFLSGVRQFDYSWTVFAFLIANYIGLVVANVSQRTTASLLGANIIEELRLRILKRIQSNTSKAKEGQVVANFTSSMTSLENTIVFTMWRFLVLAVVIFVSGATLVFLGWHLSLVVFACMAIMAKIPQFFSKKAAYYLNHKKQAEWKLVGSINEEMRLRRVIRICLLTEYRQQLFNKLLQTAKKVQFHYNVNLALVGNSTFLSTHFVRVLILIVGAVLISEFHRLTIIELTGFYLALSNFSSAVSSLASTHASIAQGAAGLAHIEELLAEPAAPTESKQRVELPPFSKNIVFKEVYFKYKDEYALSDINLEIQAGQTVAFVGTSGSGKSTLLHLLLGDIQTTEGHITLDGINLNDIDLPSMFKQIGVIYQDSLLFATTIANNIRAGKLDATHDEMITAAKQAGLHDDVIKLPLGYDTWVGRTHATLSGGQRQRIAIARALISNPAILYLDEATSALDPINCEAIDQTLEAMAGSRTVISVTHRLKSAVHADQIFVMDKGRIVERGKHEELLTKRGLYHALWETEDRGQRADDR